MYYGKETDELKKAREEQEGIFGYDPNGEIELEFNEQDEYLAVLLQCIEETKICLMYLENNEKTILIQETME